MFEHSFLIRAMIAGAAIGTIAPLLGLFLVTRRYTFLTDTLAHVALTGLALGLFTSMNPLLTGLVAAVLVGLIIEYMRMRRQMSGDASLALFLYGSLASASVLLSMARGPVPNLSSLLFGSLVTVRPDDLLVILSLAIIVVFCIGAFYRFLFCVSFDEEWAASAGVPVARMQILLVLLAGITVGLSMTIVGTLLVGALMVIPAVAAMQLQQGFARTLLLGVLLSWVSVSSGIGISYHVGWPTGGTIVLVALSLFLLCPLLGTMLRRRRAA